MRRRKTKRRKSKKVYISFHNYHEALAFSAPHNYATLGGSSDEKEVNEEQKRNGMILEEDEEVRYEMEEEDDDCEEDDEEMSSDEADVAREERFTQETVYSTVRPR